MSFVLSDHSLWPLGMLVARGAQSLEQHMRMLAIWDDWFSHDERFVSLRIYRDDAALDQAPGTARATKAWLQGGAAEKMRDLVSSMVMVVPPSRYEAMRHLSTETVFGVPGGIFADVEEAFDWLQRRQALEGPVIEDARRILAGMVQT